MALPKARTWWWVVTVMSVITTRAQFYPDGQKPSGKTGKAIGATFLTTHRQELADWNSSTGKTYFFWRWADRKQFLTAVPDGSSRRLTSNLPKLVPVSATVRNMKPTGIHFYPCHFRPSWKTAKPSGIEFYRLINTLSIIHICALYNIYVSTCKSQSALKSTQMIITRLQFNHKITFQIALKLSTCSMFCHH